MMKNGRGKILCIHTATGKKNFMDKSFTNNDALMKAKGWAIVQEPMSPPPADNTPPPSDPPSSDPKDKVADDETVIDSQKTEGESTEALPPPPAGESTDASDLMDENQGY